MSNRYFPRNNQRVDWLDDFAKKLANKEKTPETIVDQKRNISSSFVDQITQIVSGGAKFSTVESKVKDMQERTGMNDYLRKIKAKEMVETINTRVASELSKEPEMFSKLDKKLVEDMKSFIQGKINSHHGQTSVPAVLQALFQTFKTHGLGLEEANDPELISYIENKIAESQKLLSRTENTSSFFDSKNVQDHESHPANEDVFYSLDPKNTNK